MQLITRLIFCKFSKEVIMLAQDMVPNNNMIINNKDDTTISATTLFCFRFLGMLSPGLVGFFE